MKAEDLFFIILLTTFKGFHIFFLSITYFCTFTVLTWRRGSQDRSLYSWESRRIRAVRMCLTLKQDCRVFLSSRHTLNKWEIREADERKMFMLQLTGAYSCFTHHSVFKIPTDAVSAEEMTSSCTVTLQETDNREILLYCSVCTNLSINCLFIATLKASKANKMSFKF